MIGKLKLRCISWIRNKLGIETISPPRYSGISYLCHRYNSPFHPVDPDYDTPKTVWVIYNRTIKKAVLMRVPQHVPGEPFLGKVGILSPTLETFIPMYRIFESEKLAQSFLDQEGNI